MLQAIRERAQGIFAWVMLIAVGIPFALWGIQNYIDTGKESPAAVVGDRGRRRGGWYARGFLRGGFSAGGSSEEDGQEKQAVPRNRICVFHRLVG